ncbi:putative metal-sulfur cluster biosynthetic enzyme [Mycobacterium tuberculosis]|nr:putative metal-sulfur cluster biosynthetic enzyme [Mycobacterium tuberculosis]
MSETSAPAEELLADVEEAMRDVVDPELGINVVDLGLVYGLDVQTVTKAPSR